MIAIAPFQELKKKLQHYYYPRWLVNVLGKAISASEKFGNYPLASPSNSLSCSPLFIISAGRSGTTLLRSMLVTGGELAIPPESYIIPMTILRFPVKRYAGWQHLCHDTIHRLENHTSFPVWEANLKTAYETALTLPQSERSLARLFDEIFKCYAAQKFPEATLWGDQSPINTLYLPWLIQLFPYARYLHLLRDGRDAVASYIDRGLKVQEGNRSHLLSRYTKRWKLSVQQAMWLQEQINEDQFIEIRYEALVSKPVHSLEQICNFIGIRCQPQQMLNYYQSPTTVEHKYQLHHSNLTKPLFTKSIGSWRERLSTTEQEYILSQIGELLTKCDYIP